MRLKCVLIFVVLLLATSCSMKGPVFGLKPEYPENRIDTDEIMFVEVDSLQPTLQWESFPRPQDLIEEKEGRLYLIRNVTYDLKIWSAEGDYLNAIIYSKKGLSEPYYKLEEPLEPCSNYFWTVRARFEIDGKLRITEWGISQRGGAHQIYHHIGIKSPPTLGRRSPIVPNPNFYRFKTSCPKSN